MTAWSTLAELSHLGDAIRERRAELGWTQAELARRTGIPQADISRLENGRLDARWSTIQRICAALASTTEHRRRSLANGRMVNETLARPGKKWSAKDKTASIARAKK
jgi:predicted transcriptional regulator